MTNVSGPTLMRTSWTLGGATSTSSMDSGFPAPQATAALHFITLENVYIHNIFLAKKIHKCYNKKCLSRTLPSVSMATLHFYKNSLQSGLLDSLLK